MQTIHFLGIDISKKYFNFCLLNDEGKILAQSQVDNGKTQIASMFKALKKANSVTAYNLIVCMEHTGIYCNILLHYLHTNQIKTCVEPALQIKQSMGMTRGKNDKIDALRIAQYALKNLRELKFWKPEREVIQKLKYLLSDRERLVKAKLQLQAPIEDKAYFLEKEFREELTSNADRSIRAILKDISKVEKDIRDLIKSDQQISRMVEFAKSVPGVGIITAINMIITSGEFKRIADPKKFACYSGVAPFENRSGTSRRGKTKVSKLANTSMKRLLHLAAMAAIKSSSDIKAYYQRKLAQGKNKMSSINAVRNKLIARVYSCVQNERLYQKNYINQLV
jgi:transposase